MTTTTGTTIESMSDGRPRSGRWIVAAKELADNLLSMRFALLLGIIALVGLAAVSSAASEIREVASATADAPSVFLLLFTVSPGRIPSFLQLVGFMGPLLGLAYGFDAINRDRAGGTLPRLVAQPIHRDDVLTGKFLAGLATIALAIGTLTAMVAGYGIVRLGITPGLGDLARIVAFAVLVIVYIGVWLALAVLMSVITRRSATAVLASMAAWLALTLFAGLIFGGLADVLSPVGNDPSPTAVIDNARTELTVSRISPEQLYNEAASVLLNPQARTVGIVSPQQLDQAIPDTLPWLQSLLLVWPHVVALVAVTVVLFIASYLLFMRQEIRA